MSLITPRPLLRHYKLLPSFFPLSKGFITQRSISNSPILNIHSTKYTYIPKSDDTTSILLERNLVHRNQLSHTDSVSFRCTVFDSLGNLSSISKEIKRSELTSKYGLFPRDLRKLERIGHKNDIAPSISVRKDSIVVNLLHIRALIKADTVILFDNLTLRNSDTQTQFINDLQSRLKLGRIESDLPYEMRALEAILISALNNLSAEMKVNITVTQGLLNDLEEDVTRDKLRNLLIQNKKITRFAQRTTLVRDMIDELLDNDDDLAGMYLSDKITGTPRTIADHAEVEMLLESYYKHCDEIVQTISSSISNVRTTEEIINIILDSHRNQLMLLGLRFSIGLLALSLGMFCASAYGMNLENFIEEQDFGMGLVIVLSVISMVALFGYSTSHLKKLQKITMMGDHHHRAGPTNK